MTTSARQLVPYESPGGASAAETTGSAPTARSLRGAAGNGTLTAAVTALHQAGGRRTVRWFERQPRPELAAIAVGVELKGTAGSASRLGGTTVSIAGLGAVGGPTLSGLARTGVGLLNGFDFDRYERESWLTQPSNSNDTGRLKAQVQAERASAASAGGGVRTAAAYLQESPWWVLRQSDVLVSAGDNLEVLVWAGRMACALGIPLIQGAVHGETWTAFVRAYDFRDPESACPACAMSRADWLTLRSRFGCDPGRMKQQALESTRTPPHVCRTAADLLASETVKTLLDVDGRLAGEELSYCLLSHRTMQTTLPRNPDCRCPHQRWSVVDVDDTTATLSTLAREVSPQGTLEDFHVRAELPWISFTLCGCSEEPIPVRQFGRAGWELSECRCGEPLRAAPLGVRSQIPADDLAAVADVPLSELQLPSGAAVGFDDDTAAAPTWFFVGAPPELNAEQLLAPTEASTTKIQQSFQG